MISGWITPFNPSRSSVFASFMIPQYRTAILRRLAPVALTIPLIAISGCGSGASTPGLPSDMAVTMKMPIASIANSSRVFSRSLAICGSPYSLSLSGGVYIVTPSGSTKYTYTDSGGNTYAPTYLATSSRNGWCIFGGPGYSIFYNALTKQAAWYPLPAFGIGVADEKTLINGLGAVRWDGTGFTYVDPLTSASRSGFNGVGQGEGLSVAGASDTSPSVPAIFGNAVVTTFSPLSPGQSSTLILFGGDGNYYGTSRRGDPTVAVKWTSPTSPVEIPGVGADIRDVNASGDILATPTLYKGVVKSSFSVDTDSGAGTLSPSESLSIADDGAILGTINGKGFTLVAVVAPK